MRDWYDAPLYPPLTARQIDLLIAAGVNEAYSIQEHSPAQAVLVTDAVHALQRHQFACRDFAYKPAPIDVVVEMETVAAIVREWDGPSPGEQA